MSKVLVAVFPSRGSMVDAADKINSLSYVDLKQTAIIAKAEDGETVVMEDDLSPVEGRIVGGTLGSMMGALGVAGLGALLLPGVGALIAIGAGALAGALVGGTTGDLTARALDFGFKDGQIKAIADHLSAGRVAMMMEINDANDTVMATDTTTMTADGTVVTTDGTTTVGTVPSSSLIARLTEDLKPYAIEVMEARA